MKNFIRIFLGAFIGFIWIASAAFLIENVSVGLGVAVLLGIPAGAGLSAIAIYG